jgi:DNA polymerase III subunit chi
MARVEFHSGVAEPLHFACRLLRKALRQGVPVLVTAPARTLQALDRELWTFEAQEFVPHLRVRLGQEVDAALLRTPIWLCEGEPPTASPRVLLNLGGHASFELSRFERIIEVVSADAEERQLARERWRDYEARGWDIKHHAQATA